MLLILGDFEPQCSYQIFLIFLTVDGQWGKWGAWTECSLSCRGVKQRTLQCNNPPPQNGGKDCEGKDEKDKTEKMLCDKSDCNGKNVKSSFL